EHAQLHAVHVKVVKGDAKRGPHEIGSDTFALTRRIAQDPCSDNAGIDSGVATCARVNVHVKPDAVHWPRALPSGIQPMSRSISWSPNGASSIIAMVILPADSSQSGGPLPLNGNRQPSRTARPADCQQIQGHQSVSHRACEVSLPQH